MMCLLLSAVACGSKEAVIDTPAKEMNLSAADLGADWSQMADMGLDEMPSLAEEHIQDASMRMLTTEKLQGMLITIVFSTKTVASAKTEMKGDAVQNMVESLQEQISEATFEQLEPPSVGDEAQMVGGNVPDLDYNVYVLTFRKANVMAVFSLIGPEDWITERLAAEYARKLEAKIH